MPDDLLSRLTAIASSLDVLRFDPDAECFYELMSGALVWRDEIPDLPPEQLWAMRPLWRYRTTIILSEPDPNLKPFWEVAVGLFPQWPGLHESRRSTAWAAFYNRKRADWNERIERCLDAPDKP